MISCRLCPFLSGVRSGDSAAFFMIPLLLLYDFFISSYYRTAETRNFVKIIGLL